MTDKGYTLYSKNGINVAAKMDQSGKIIEEAFNPEVHGKEIPLQQKPEASVEDDRRYQALIKKKELQGEVSLSKEEKADIVAYEKRKSVAGVLGAEARGEAYGKNRPLRVIDLTTFRPTYKTMRDMEKEPDKYVELTEGTKAERQLSLIEDIRGGITMLRKSIASPKLIFDEPSRLAIFKAVDATDPKTSLGNLIAGQFGKTLSDEQQNYLADTLVLAEQMMAMRSVLGAGQGSEDLRRAIKATIPSRGTFSKEYAMKQLDKTEKTLNRLSRGVLNVPLREVVGTGMEEEVPIPPTPTPKKNIKSMSNEELLRELEK
jgi:hypothetical protein